MTFQTGEGEMKNVHCPSKNTSPPLKRDDNVASPAVSYVRVGLLANLFQVHI